jgi:hypothetical protein
MQKKNISEVSEAARKLGGVKTPKKAKASAANAAKATAARKSKSTKKGA